MCLSVSALLVVYRSLVYTVGSKGAKLSPLCLRVATLLNTYTSVAQPERIPCAVAQNYNTYNTGILRVSDSIFNTSKFCIPGPIL